MTTVIAPKDGRKWEEVFPEALEDPRELQILNSSLLLVVGWKSRSDKTDKTIFWNLIKSLIDTDNFGTPENSWKYTKYIFKILEMKPEVWRER